MRIGIVDADLLGRDKHRFPNLVCEKLSGYWKEKGAEVELLLDYDHFSEYDEVYISKVFTDTPVPEWIAAGVDMDNVKTTLPSNVHVGGTGFFFAHAPNLPDEIEHHMPDYHLYDKWLEQTVEEAKKQFALEGKELPKSYMIQFKEYTDYSIGFTTRGCFRKCKFCVNQKYDHVFKHSPLEEFYDPSMPKICLLDDNILGCPEWRSIIQALKDTGKPFKFKQGIDERLLTREKCEVLFSSRYDGDYTFAFDNISDYDLIESKLKLIRQYAKPKASIKFYVLVGFEGTDVQDIENAFKRVALLMHYQCLPYIMRYQNKNDTPWKRSEWRGMYVALARWCNQPSFYKKKSFRQYCIANQEYVKKEGSICATYRVMLDFEEKYPEIAARYFDIRFDHYGEK